MRYQLSWALAWLGIRGAGVDHGRSGLPIASLGTCQRVGQGLGTCAEWTGVD